MLNQNFTEKYSDQVSVEDMLADLIPGFLKNKATDLVILNQALSEKDFDKIKKIGHNWKGACSSYGFDYLGEVGKQFENLAAKSDTEKLEIILKSLPEYLKNVQVNYVSSLDDDSLEESQLHN
ncbi:MAG: Hpt domain-containing protein [Bdellovibrionaceae bacterium]|nr:Hpt domain-containing protein [Bdellovibrio sp.]